MLVKLPLSRRRELLESLLAAPIDPLRLSPLLQAPSDQILEAVRKLGLEGIVGKQIDSIYEPGEGSGAWIKLRTNLEQEFVIGGYIPGARGFDALLVGVYEKKRLIFLAKVTYVAAKLSLADHLAKGPRGADELADWITGQC